MEFTPILTALVTAVGGVLVAWMNNRFKSILEKMSKVEEDVQQVKKLAEKNESSINNLEAKMSTVTGELSDNNLRTLRLDLLHAIETDPDNQIVIMEMAKKYFVEMKGNCYMSKVFQEWAEDHHVNITGLFNKD